MLKRSLGAALVCAGLLAHAAAAQTMPPMTMQADGAMAHAHGPHHMHRHGPVGLPGRHQIPQGRVVLIYRLGAMAMSGIRSGTDDLGETALVTTVPNAFAGMPGQPPTIRMAPVEMTGEMHMLGAMYGASDRLTLMGMVPYLRKSMTMRTYAGPVGTTVLGESTARTDGLGDIRLGALWSLRDKGRSRVTFGLGLSLPTGSITETGRMLSPMGTTPEMRLAYSMQLGSGTHDLHPALTWENGRGPVNWGGQVRAILRLGENDEDYRLGHEAALSGWLSYRAAPWISYSARLEYRYADRIHGRDPQIMGPSLGADPRNYGGHYITLHAGADIAPKRGALKGHRIGLELGLPLYQDLNGVQSKTDWVLALAWRKPF
ncbi:MAG: alpha-amylase [Roseovarius sp.]|nr:alpha-amylase [Roseovarius sp.]|tara:strand:- start:912 stop:2033 length:1122 start_codon:yes stop_codon:yes gene_type:complete